MVRPPKMSRASMDARRRRRGLAAGLALRLLRLAFGAEEAEMRRCSDELDRLDLAPGCAPPRAYDEIEGEHSACEFALGFLRCAIDDLEFAYHGLWRRFGGGDRRRRGAL